MSLKAKIEAVIYAAEEPVTLSQLVGLLSHEAAAELDRIASAQQRFDLDEPPPASDPDLLNEEIVPIEEETPEDVTPTEDQESLSAAPPVIEGGSEKRAAREDKERARVIREFLRSILDQLVRDYATSDRGLEIREVAGGFRLSTKPEYHDAVRGFVKSLKPPLKLTLQALETLAVVAYKQPVTAPEISEIRGVDSGGVLGSLMARKLVTTAGRKQVIGRPILYKTTKDFLLRFGLKDINELPSIEEFEKMAGDLADSEPVQEEMPMSQESFAESPHVDPELTRSSQMGEAHLSNVEEEKDATEPQADGDGATVESVTVSTVGTPEGDNEFAPDQPLTPAPEGLQRTPAIDTNKV